MDEANRYRGEVAFPAEYYGEGVVLRYRTADLVALADKYGVEYRAAMTSGLLDQRNPKVLIDCLVHGLKRADGSKFPLMPKDQQDLPFAHDAVSALILDALFLSWHGKKATEFVEEAQSELARVTAASDTPDLDDDAPPPTSSSGSSTPPPGPDSFPTLSGD